MASPLPSKNKHTAFQQLPIVNISRLSSTDLSERKEVAVQLGKAASEVGFLYVTGHGISPEIIKRLKDKTREYFTQPLKEKMLNYIGNSVNHSGYVPEGEEQPEPDSILVDNKETYDVNCDFISKTGRRPMLGPNQWPDLPNFKEDITAYYDQAIALSHRLFKGFSLALGLPENTFEKITSSPPSQLRLIHYPYNEVLPENRPGIGAHTDYECFTILLPTAPGLEVLNGSGEWVDIPLVDDAFVINIGDMLEILSNGHFVATSHRVRKVAEERYSFPLFCACDYDTIISPLTELIDQNTPSRYTSLACGDHLYSQTIQSFSYLKKQLKAGKIKLPEGAKKLSSFGYKSQEVK